MSEEELAKYRIFVPSHLAFIVEVKRPNGQYRRVANWRQLCSAAKAAMESAYRARWQTYWRYLAENAADFAEETDLEGLSMTVSTPSMYYACPVELAVKAL